MVDLTTGLDSGSSLGLLEPGLELQRKMSVPSRDLVRAIERLDGDILVLGAGGKLGPSLIDLALSARTEAETNPTITAVSRFSDPDVKRNLVEKGVSVVHADLSSRQEVGRLPDAENVIFLAGSKFGSSANPASTWHTNVVIPAMVAERFAESRIVALSSGNVYPMRNLRDGPATEETPPNPNGEYGMTCLGRERVLQHASLESGTQVGLIRLNYAVEMTYGVLVDLAQTILRAEPVDVSATAVNVVWQGYVNEVILRSLEKAASPAFVLNVAGPETLAVRSLARLIAREMDREVVFDGEEGEAALISSAASCTALFGYPAVSVAELVAATAAWVSGGGQTIDKPTKFERIDGRF